MAEPREMLQIRFVVLNWADFEGPDEPRSVTVWRRWPPSLRAGDEVTYKGIAGNTFRYRVAKGIWSYEITEHDSDIIIIPVKRVKHD